MTAAFDLAPRAYPQMRYGNHFGRHGEEYRIGQYHTVKCQFNPSLTKEAPRVAGLLEMTRQVGASGKDGAPKSSHTPTWQRTGSPTSAVRDDKLGSSSVHCKSIPAGRTSSAEACTAALASRHTTAVTNNDALSIVTSLVRVTNGYESGGLGPFKNGRCPAVRSSSFGRKNYFRFIGNESALNEEPRGEGD
jgi:hypothetical protein